MKKSNWKIGLTISVAFMMAFYFSNQTDTTLSKIEDDFSVYAIQTSASNVYFIETGGKKILIDVGDKSKRKSIEKELDKIGVSISEIDFAIATHGHGDHVSNGKYFQETYDLEIWGGAGDELLFKEGKRDDLCPTGLFAKIYKRFSSGKYPAFTPNKLVGEVIDLQQFGINGQVMPLPGHTEGSLIIQIENKLFVGDLIRGGLFKKSKPTLHYYICDVDENTQHIKMLLDKFDQCDEWFLGHYGSLKRADLVKYVAKQTTSKSAFNEDIPNKLATFLP